MKILYPHDISYHGKWLNDKFIFNSRVWGKGGAKSIIFCQWGGVEHWLRLITEGVEKGQKIDYVICERSLGLTFRMSIFQNNVELVTNSLQVQNIKLKSNWNSWPQI